MPKFYGWVREVTPESPADLAGISPGDKIHAINGHPIRDLVDFQFYTAEDELLLAVERNGRAIDVLLAKEPDEETGTTPDVADLSLNAEQQILRKERLAAIKKHVLALPEKQRAAVLMHKYETMDYREIAKVLKLSESATKSLLFRAYETLRERLKEFV